MDSTDIQARVQIAAALIMSRTVEVPVPASGDWSNDPAAVRLRELTDYLYQIIATPGTRFAGGRAARAVSQ